MPALHDNNRPHLKFSRRLGTVQENTGTQLYDVKFYPYNPSEPIFAVAGNQHVIVARLLDDPDKGLETLCYWKKEDAVPRDRSTARDPTQLTANALNSLCWARDPLTGDPLICVSGTDATINVLNVRTASLVRTLVGHGGPINDLAVNPVRPYIIASGAEDHTVRIWDLSADSRQPCAAILAGHVKGLLSLTWHHSGLYLLSGGQDAAICLWVMPSINMWPDKWFSGPDDSPQQGSPSHNNGTQKVLDVAEPALIYHPHFRTTEVHFDMVDSLVFYDSLIFSKAAEEGRNRIVLWRIPGFEPDSHHNIYTPTNPKPPMPQRYFATGPAAEADDETRSAFHNKGQLKLEQLLTLEITGAEYFYIRMGLLSAGRHSALAFANGDGLVSFWDLSLLERSLARPARTVSGCPEADIDHDPILGIGSLSGGGESYENVSNERNDEDDEDTAGPVKPGRRQDRRSSQASLSSPKAKGGASSKANIPGGKRSSTDATLPLRQRNELPMGTDVMANPFRPIPAHHSIQITKPARFNARAVAWSTEGYGRWCVVVGDMGMISVFERPAPPESPGSPTTPADSDNEQGARSGQRGTGKTKGTGNYTASSKGNQK